MLSSCEFNISHKSNIIAIERKLSWKFFLVPLSKYRVNALNDTCTTHNYEEVSSNIRVGLTTFFTCLLLCNIVLKIKMYTTDTASTIMTFRNR